MKAKEYIRLEEGVKQFVSETDDSQFEIYELLAMFAAKSIKELKEDKL